MLLHSLRRSRTLARWVLVWFAFAMGVAVAAPVVQPLNLGGICSASAAMGDPQSDADAAGLHTILQCVLCLGAGAPPVTAETGLGGQLAPQAPVPTVPVAVALASRNSPLLARAPPAAQ